MKDPLAVLPDKAFQKVGLHQILVFPTLGHDKRYTGDHLNTNRNDGQSYAAPLF